VVLALYDETLQLAVAANLSASPHTWEHRLAFALVPPSTRVRSVAQGRGSGVGPSTRVFQPNGETLQVCGQTTFGCQPKCLTLGQELQLVLVPVPPNTQARLDGPRHEAVVLLLGEALRVASQQSLAATLSASCFVRY
jgi:hypothetical protein